MLMCSSSSALYYYNMGESSDTTTQDTGSKVEEKFVGCYKNASQLGGSKDFERGLTIEQCRTKAKEKGIKRFAMEWPQGYTQDEAKNGGLISSCWFVPDSYDVTKEGSGKCEMKQKDGKVFGGASEIAVYKV
jgi:hypothetical protein